MEHFPSGSSQDWKLAKKILKVELQGWKPPNKMQLAGNWTGYH